MRTGVIIQARMSSARLPGKVLLPLAGVPVLERTVDRARLATRADLVVVATSADASDDPVADLCARVGAPVHRGPLNDVATRVVQTADALDIDAVVRVSADSPFIDPALLDRGIGIFLEGGAEVVTNVQPRSFPVGQSVEVFFRRSLAAALDSSPPALQREHVTAIFYAAPQEYRIRNFAHHPPVPDVRLVIDTERDLVQMQALAHSLGDLPPDFGWEALLERMELPPTA